ncbi:helix-turn-helix transcriptional regulator [Nocardioides pantholopis]|uniref:helix-turn-helix transcriptional regulator n=1 Tax=Nocardioides pantholopis TaxID=2483798 RepID=UPI000F08B061|nr:helix-turn-helix transcriptional regulator [Nocardioides pantholopis]
MARRARQDEVRRIHNRVAVLRAETKLSRAQLAERVGVNPQTIGALERGEHYPSLQLAMSICEVFGVPIEAVFSREPFPSVTATYRRPDPQEDPS